MNQEYIDNDKDNGMLYDIEQIKKDYKKLKCPVDVYNPLDTLDNNCAYNLLLSERSVGKTTNILLLALCFYKQGCTTAYIRESNEQITPKKLKTLFKTVLAYGYVNKLFPEFNTITYKSRYWYLAKKDEEGHIIEADTKPFMVNMSLDESFDYKSTFNSDDTDFIIFDEFISNVYKKDQFVNFMDLHKTISRERLSVRTYLLSNTVDLEHEFFYEFMIADKVKSLKAGEKAVATSDLGTSVFVHWVDVVLRKKKKKKTNKKYYGFNNPKLASITGEGWQFSNYPHIPKIEEAKLVLNNYYVVFNENLIKLNVYNCSELGYYVTAHKASRLYDDSIIYTLDEITSKNERYLQGFTKIDKFIWSLYKKNKFYYSNNSIGLMIEKYVKACHAESKFY